MFEASGFLRKMRVTAGTPVEYQLVLRHEASSDEDEPAQHLIDLNAYIGRDIQLDFSGQIGCVNCGRQTSKSFSQGYCYPCFRKLAECDLCVMSPEKCHYHEGTCRDPEWGEANCMQDHVVYLANSSAIKVGITRQGQMPTRWIDQGAIQALPILHTSTRQLAGLAEDCIREFVSDRTQWQTMLKGRIPEIDLASEWQSLLPKVKDKLDDLSTRHGEGALNLVEPDEITRITFPVETHPEKVKSLNFDKTPEIEGRLQGIKGQYLILDSGVLNVRKFTAYQIQFAAQ